MFFRIFVILVFMGVILMWFVVLVLGYSLFVSVLLDFEEMGGFVMILMNV